jgi:hypothetical protein
MRRFSTLAAAAAIALAAGSAQALVITVDDFNGPDMAAADMTIGGSLASAGPAGPVNPPGVLQRTLTHDLLAGVNDGTGSSVKIGSLTYPAGALESQNQPGRNSEVTVSWALAAGFIPDTSAGPASVLFEVLFSDLNVNFKLYWDNVLYATNSFAAYDGLASYPPAIPMDVTFDLTPTQQNTINGAAGTLKLVIDGPSGWDLTLDALNFQVPEPTSLALVGLALIGAGVASRRRKA